MLVSKQLLLSMSFASDAASAEIFPFPLFPLPQPALLEPPYFLLEQRDAPTSFETTLKFHFSFVQ